MTVEYFIGLTNVELEQSMNRYYNQKITEYLDELEKVGRFTQYANRGQTNPQTIRRQHALGKKGECLAYDLLMHRGYDHRIEPDFTVTETHGFDNDLDYGSMPPVHVKTKEPSDRWGLSWTFQSTDPALRSPGDTVALVVLASPTFAEGQVAAVLPMQQVAGLLRDPEMAHVRGKRVLYWEDFGIATTGALF